MNTIRPNTTRERLAKMFPGKEINRLISFRRRPRRSEADDSFGTSSATCPLSFTERLVYSFMLFRCRRKGQHVPVSISKLARLSNLHRTTVKKALDSLEACRVVTHGHQGWELVASDRTSRLRNHEWYGFRKKGCTIGDLGYHYFVQPTKASPVTIVASLVMVADALSKSKKSAACLAGRFAVHKKTIQRARRKGLTRPDAPEHFKDAAFGPKKQAPVNRIDFVSSLTDPGEQRVAKAMLHANVPATQDEIKEFLLETRRRHPNPESRMYFLIALIGDGNADRSKTLPGVLDSHRGHGSWMGLLQSRLGWGKNQDA